MRVISNGQSSLVYRIIALLPRDALRVSGCSTLNQNWLVLRSTPYLTAVGQQDQRTIAGEAFPSVSHHGIIRHC